MIWPFKRSAPANPPLNRPEPRLEPRLARRSFAAAYSDRLASGFNALLTTPPRAELRREIRGLVGHARHAAQNFDYARAYEMLFRRHVIGPNGIRLQMDVRDAPDRKDTSANKAIEAAWAKWGKMGSPSICARLSWWGLECQIATAIAREGGAFVRLYEGRGRGAFGFQIEAVPFDLLDLDLTQPLSGGAFIESGIEFDASGKVLAYHFWNLGQEDGHRPLHRRRLRIPARQMIQVLVPEEIGQALGVPRSATALRLMNMSKKYQDSAMMAANYGAAQMVFFEQADEAGQLRAAPDAEVPIDDLEAGTMAMLPPGVKAVPHAPHYPEAAIEPFMRYMNTSQAAGLGVAYETLTADLSRANFSSLRAGKGEERDEWRMLQRALFEGLHGRIFERWLPMAILSGQLRLPLEKLDKFNAPLWRPRGWASVNPKDDAVANQTEVSLGTKSLTEIVAERGRDFEDLCAERAEEKRVLEKYQLSPGEVIAPSKTEPGETEQELSK